MEIALALGALWILSQKGSSSSSSGAAGVATSSGWHGNPAAASAASGAAAGIPPAHPPAAQIGTGSSASFADKATNILANKTGTTLICKGVSTYYTGGLANGACSTVADIAQKVTKYQVQATVAVGKFAAHEAAAAYSAVKSSAVGNAAYQSAVAPLKVASAAYSTVKSWF